MPTFDFVLSSDDSSELETAPLVLEPVGQSLLQAVVDFSLPVSLRDESEKEILALIEAGG